ncbi:MAG TPA: TrbI/VirB10 family protein [Sphingomonas sp.]|nr:TrbI/VirB10 family protein [Sphingomonas sp.]
MAVEDRSDPRRDPEVGSERDIRPVVRRPRAGPSGLAIGIGIAVAALILFYILDSRRLARIAPATQPQSSLAAESAAPPPLYIPPQPPPPVSAPTPVSTPLPAPAPSPVTPPPVVYMPAPSPPAAPVQPAPPSRNLASPALVVDNGVNAPAANSNQAATRQPATGTAAGLDTQRTHAAMFSDPAATVPQGTLIPAILETGLDSSHAGFARALVQQDVRGFDGTHILIPRGSRLIGEYSGGVAQGQKRAFIVWTRLIRPDGVTIAIGSPAADPVGSAGIKAHVNSHFLARFSGAILQSVLDLGVNLASRSTNSPVVVALPGSLQGTAGTVVQPAQIAPTLKVKPGTSISVFVARDLDFRGAEKTSSDQ